MIHDVLLSCLDLLSRRLPIEDFVISDAVSVFLHPCEKSILKDILDIINLLRDVAKFTKIYGSNHHIPTESPICEADEPLQNGLYLKALAHGINKVLEDFYTDIKELEHQYLMNPAQTLLYIYQKLQAYEPLAYFLKLLINHIKRERLHGCRILSYLHQNVLHGDDRIKEAMKKILATVNVVFCKQLSHWILYARIVDTYGEFFIQSAEADEYEKATSSGSGKHTSTILSDAASTYAEIWHYQISFEYVPRYLPCSWAEKVFFIGQTVLMFSMDSNRNNMKTHTNWNKPESDKFQREEISLWNGQDHVFFAKIQALQDTGEIKVTQYERLINEIKSFVTHRLSVIAVDQADLEKELKLIKDFYLMARGELFLEYIRLTYAISQDKKNENKPREYLKAFEVAAHAVGITDELEQFPLVISSDFRANNSMESDFLEYVQLNYKIKWPLHLLFAPVVIKRYNKVFRFLLLLKKIQYELHMTWFMHLNKDQKAGRKSPNMKTLLLQNQLMFFIDNLQYYIQVDVLESQFSIFLQTVLNKADFEEITRAHSFFLANILSFCFLLGDEDAMHGSILHSISIVSCHPVRSIFNDIFVICEKFCSLFRKQDGSEDTLKNINQLDEEFTKSIEALLDLLSSLKGSTAPLSQFILRLDFNHWFSSKRKSSG